MKVYILLYEQGDYSSIEKVFESEESLRKYVKKERPEFKLENDGDYIFVSKDWRQSQEALNIVIEEVQK